MAAKYLPSIHSFPNGLHAGVTRRADKARAAFVCRHYHATAEAAQVCAEAMAAARNAR